MTPEQIEQTIREYIEQVVHMSLATTKDNKPWVCEVHFAYDNALNIYFRSDADRRHSLEIAHNPHVAGTIVTQHFKNQKPRGVYFEGKAERLAEVNESHPAYTATAARFGTGQIHATTSGGRGPQFYKITVLEWYVFDTYGPAPAGKYHLPWNS